MLHYKEDCDIVTNSVCLFCNDRFNATLEQLLVCGECGNVCHQRCYILTDECNCNNGSMICESEIKKYSLQKHTDVQTLKRTNYEPSFIDYARGFIFRAPYLLFHFSLLYLDYLYGNVFGKYSQYRYKTFLNAVVYGLNINSKIFGKNNINPNSKVIYVTNHVSFYDALTIPRYINSGAIASISTIRHLIAKILSKYTNIIFVKRGESSKEKPIVEQLNDFIRVHNNIIICPQGLLGKYNTLSQFRTTAFRTNYPVQPIVLKYKQDVSSMEPLKMLLYPRVDVEIHVIKVTKKSNNETPDQYADKIRLLMANKCGLILSNVHSRDIKD